MPSYHRTDTKQPFRRILNLPEKLVKPVEIPQNPIQTQPMAVTHPAPQWPWSFSSLSPCLL